jgi:hypothetical protein
MNNNSNYKENESTFPLFSLLPEIIRSLPNYFLEEPEQNKSVFKFSHGWRNFMNTSKKQFGQWKKESQLIVLREPLVDSFYNSLQIRQQIFGYIEDPGKQLELEFNARYHHFNMGLGLIPFAPVPPIDLKFIDNVKRVSIRCYEVIPAPVKNINQLEFGGCSIHSSLLLFFSEVPTLYIHCEDDESNETFDFGVYTISKMDPLMCSIALIINLWQI